MNYNIIGAGRLGKNIAKALTFNLQLSLGAICNRSLESAFQASTELGFGTVSKLIDLPSAEVTWITCNDDDIEVIVELLCKHSVITPNSLVVHCSGVLSSTVLLPLKAQGCAIASMHPLKSFRAGLIDEKAFLGVDCVVEGDIEACDWLTATLQALGAHVIPVKPETKAAYHAAAAIASNYLITLAATSEELLSQAGLNAEQRHRMICNLMQTTLDNLKQTPDIAQALTGPLMRGDINTLNLHLQAIENPVIKQLYQAAGLATLSLTQLEPNKHRIIEQIMQSGVSRETSNYEITN